MSEAAVRAYAREKRFSSATVDRWLGRSDGERDALLAITGPLRLGENQFRDLLDQMEDIAARRAYGLAEVVADPAVRDVLSRGLGRNEAIKSLKEALRRMRYPQLAETEEKLVVLGKGLRLPAGVRVGFPENLEGEHIELTLRARSAAELQAQVVAVAAAVRRSEIEEMFALLEGDW